jgi:hypothetical protein
MLSRRLKALLRISAHLHLTYVTPPLPILPNSILSRPTPSCPIPDIVGLLDSLNGVGLRLRPDVPFDAQLLAKYFFRYTTEQRRGEERREQISKHALFYLIACLCLHSLNTSSAGIFSSHHLLSKHFLTTVQLLFNIVTAILFPFLFLFNPFRDANKQAEAREESQQRR